MKKIICAFCTVAVILSICACTAQRQSYEDLPIPASLRAVLWSDEPFISTDTGEEASINHLIEVTDLTESYTVAASKFALCDLDGDGMPELILWLIIPEKNDYYGFEVLRKQDGRVYGYTFFYRAFNQLKTDGTFIVSGGAADVGIYTVTFTEEGYIDHAVAYSRSLQSDPFEVAYFIDDESVTQADYLAAVAEQNKKEDVVWYDILPQT